MAEVSLGRGVPSRRAARGGGSGGGLSESALPTLTVAAVARRLGIAPATLRTWDRRYGLGPSQHTAGSHRRYSPDDMARLLVMRRLTLEGVAPAEAAAIAQQTAVEELTGHEPPPGATLEAVATDSRFDSDSWSDTDRRYESGFGLDPRLGTGSTSGRTGAGRSGPASGAGRAGPESAHSADATAAEASGRFRVAPQARATDADPAEGSPAADGGPAATRDAGSVAASPEIPGQPSSRTTAERHAAHTAAGARADQSSLGQPSGPPDDGLAKLTMAEPGRAGGGRVIALPEGSPAARGLARAAMALDSDECFRIIRTHLERHGTVRTWEQLVSPVLIAIGERWEATGEAVEVEHLLSESVMGVMRSISAGLRHPRNARSVLLAAAEDELHGLPLHVLAAALAEQGITTRMLGVRVPRDALAAAVQRTGPAAVVVHAQLRVPDPGQLDDLPRLRPAPLLLLGGPGWEGLPVPGGAERVRRLPEAAERIVRALGL